MADLRARSLREPFSSSEVRKGVSLLRTWGTASWRDPMAVWKVRGLNPLA